MPHSVPPSDAPLAQTILAALHEEIDAHGEPVCPDRAAAIVDEVLDGDRGEQDPAPAHSTFTGFVNTIAIRGVRSFGPAQTFGLSRGLTVVYGPNGVGKTSITDALELVEHGTTSRQAQGGRETSDKTHVPHLRPDGTPGAPPEVTVTWSADCRGDVLRTSRWNWLDGGWHSREIPLSIVARRAIRQPFDARAHERLELLGRVAGLDAVTAWSEAAKELSRAETAPATSLERSFPEITSTLLQALKRNEHLRDRDRLADHIRRECVDDVPDLALSMSSLPPIPLPPTAPDGSALHAASEQLTAADAVIRGLPPTEAAELLPLLRAYVEVAAAEQTCPACADGVLSTERRHEVEAILAREESRTAAFDAHSRARDAVVSAARALGQQIVQWTPWGGGGIPKIPQALRETTIPAAWAAIETASAGWSSACASATSALRALGEHSPDRTALSMACEAVDALHAMAQAAATAYQAEAAERESLRDLMRSSQDEASRTAFLISGRETEFAQSVLDRRRDDLLDHAVQKAVAHLKQRATGRLDEEINALESSIREWTTILSPAGTPPVALKAQNPAGRSTSPGLSYSAGLGDHHALGHYSDSQLETLGVAIRLARAEREQSGGLVVLDDPSDVLDEETTKQLVAAGFDRLLSNGHQVLVLTHDRALTRAVWSRITEFAEPVEHYFVEAISLEGDRVARFAARDLRGILCRLDDVLALDSGRTGPFDDWVTWRVNAAGTLLRQAIEAALAEVEQVLGSVSAGRPAPWTPAVNLARRWERLRDVLGDRRAELQQCGGPCCRGLGDLDTLLQRIADIYALGINEASHPDVVFPPVAAIRANKGALDKVAGLLDARTEIQADRHLTCRAADALRHATECPKESEGRVAVIESA